MSHALRGFLGKGVVIAAMAVAVLCTACADESKCRHKDPVTHDWKSGCVSSDGGPAAGSSGGGEAGQTADDAGGGLGTGSADAAACNTKEETIAPSGGQHLVGTIDYPDRPPSSGDHNQCWGKWGVHDAPLAVERWVHNLEHGGVVYLYNCPDGCAADVKKLEGLVQGKDRALLTSYSDMPTRFAVVSWGHRLKDPCLDLDAFRAFYDEHVDQAPESIADGPPTGCPE